MFGDHATDRSLFAEQMLLTDDLLKGLWAEPVGKGTGSIAWLEQ
jgi:hypothetical protein